MSASITIVRRPRCATASARLSVIVVLPTPPLGLHTATATPRPCGDCVGFSWRRVVAPACDTGGDDPCALRADIGLAALSGGVVCDVARTCAGATAATGSGPTRLPCATGSAGGTGAGASFLVARSIASISKVASDPSGAGYCGGAGTRDTTQTSAAGPAMAWNAAL